MREMVFFLTHDFKPLFRRTLAAVDASAGKGRDVEVLLDDRSEPPEDLGLRSAKVVGCRRHPSAFDPLGQAHNFYIDRLSSDKTMLESYDFFWVVENDVYFHEDMSRFFDAHAGFDTDLLVSEFGQRDPGWCWLRSVRGMEATPCGVTAVAYRASRRLMKAVVDARASGVEAHMEVLLPHLCMRDDMTIRQFIPDMVSFCNTFGSPFLGLVEEDIRNGTSRYIQRKLYHPVKL